MEEGFICLEAGKPCIEDDSNSIGIVALVAIVVGLVVVLILIIIIGKQPYHNTEIL